MLCGALLRWVLTGSDRMGGTDLAAKRIGGLMRLCLLVLTAVVALVIGVPASAQYMWLDVNGDGINGCTTPGNSADNEILNPSITSIDIWISTNLNRDGSTAVCPTGENLTINSYTFVLSTASGGVAYGAWTDAMGFTIAAGGPVSNSTDYFIGRASATINQPGTYKLGSIAVTVTGNPVLSIVAHSSVDPTSQTSFGSQCGGQDFNNTMRYGENVDQIPPGDWNDVCGTESGTPVSETTWGRIKKQYSGR